VSDSVAFTAHKITPGTLTQWAVRSKFQIWLFIQNVFTPHHRK